MRCKVTVSLQNTTSPCLADLPPLQLAALTSSSGYGRACDLLPCDSAWTWQPMNRPKHCCIRHGDFTSLLGCRWHGDGGLSCRLGWRKALRWSAGRVNIRGWSFTETLSLCPVWPSYRTIVESITMGKLRLLSTFFIFVTVLPLKCSSGTFAPF